MKTLIEKLKALRIYAVSAITLFNIKNNKYENRRIFKNSR